MQRASKAIRLELLIRWPVLIPKERRVLAIRLSPDSMSGEDCGHIESDVRVERVGEGNYTKVRITPARAHWQNRDWLHVDVLVGPSVRLLAKLSLRILATAAVQQQVIEKLKPTGLRLWVRNRAGFRIAEAVTGTSGYIVPEFIIPAIDFSAFTAPFRVVQIFELITPTGRLELSRQTITLGRQDLKLRGLPTSLEDPRLFSQPGNYRLVARLEQREIAQFPFEFISEAELLSRVKVPRIEILAHARRGESSPGLTTLNWEDHKGFQAAIEITSNTIAPDILVPCSVCVRDGSCVVQQEDIVFPADRVSRTIKLRPVEFGGTGLQSQPKPARLTVAVTIGGQEKACAFILVLPPERITNFEGQLSFEVTELPFDEREYCQIVQRLGLQEQAQSNRRFWRWLQTKLS